MPTTTTSPRARAQRVFERAVLRHRDGDRRGALELYRESLAIDPRFAEAHNNLAVLVADAGDETRALEMLGRAVELAPEYAEAHHNLGLLHARAGRHAEAEAPLARAAELEPQRARWWIDLGNVRVHRFRFAAALDAYDRAVACDATDADTWNGRGLALRGLRRTAEAIAAFERAIALAPAYVDAMSNLGAVFKEVRRFDDAIRIFEHALATAPTNTDLLVNYAVVFEDLVQHERTRELAERVLSLNPECAEGWNLLGNVAFEGGDNAEALRYYEKAIALDPENRNANWNLALIWLLQGDFERGWRQFEWRTRLQSVAFDHRAFDQPAWDGSPLEGRTILLHTEQGIGDAVQFVRFAAALRAAGAGRVIVECPAAYVPLLEGVDGVDVCVARGAPLPAFDVHAYLMSLPALLGTRLDTLPARVPYLSAPDRPVTALIDAPPGVRTVGLVWAGNPLHQRDRIRSIPLETLRPLLDVPGAKFFSLQKGDAARDLASLPAGLVTDLAPHLNDFRDTMAALARLDLVITVDTSVAHIAGALARPTWILLPRVPDYRWLLEREDSPWYPTARLFRQPAPKAWDAVVQNVRRALETLVASEPVDGPPLAAASEPTTLLAAAVRRADGRPRFELAIPIVALNLSAAFAAYEAELAADGHERALRDALDEMLRAGDVVIDVEPALGITALSAATAPAGGVHVRCVEPDPAARARLARQAASNHARTLTAHATLDEAFAPIGGDAARRIVRVGNAARTADVLRASRPWLECGRLAAFAWPATTPTTIAAPLAELSRVGFVAVTLSRDAGEVALDPISEPTHEQTVIALAPWFLDELRSQSAEPAGAPAATVVTGRALPDESPAPRTAARLAIDWPVGTSSGWGVYGLNLAVQLARRTDVAPLLLAGAGAELRDPIARRALHPFIGESTELSAALAAPGARLNVDGVVLRALGNGFTAGPLAERVRGRATAGVVFFEDVAFDAEALARARALDLIVAGSTWNAEVMRAHGLDHVGLALQGIDPTVFHPAPRSGVLGDRFVIFSGGKLEFRKGQDIVVAAFRAFRARHPEALLITAWHQHWPSLMSDLSLAGHVRGVPRVSDGRLHVAEWLRENGIPADAVLDIGDTPNELMGRVLREADVALFTNRCEGGTNLVAMECMACGVPTILSANTGHLDLIRSGGCFSLENQRAVPRPSSHFRTVEGWGESDVEEVVELLERVHADRTEANRRAAIGARFMATLAWESQVARLVDLVRPLLA